MHVTADANPSSVPMNGKAPKTTTVFADENLGISDILDDAMGSRPEASNRADTIIAESVKNDGPFVAGNTDRTGTVFDPSIHEADSSGNPRLSGDGLFRRKRGRRAGVDYHGIARNESGSESQPGPDGSAISRTEAIKAGKSTAALFFTFGQACFGIEWAPLTKAQTGGVDEQQYLAEKFADYYEVRGLVKLPPEIGLAIAVAGAVAPRLALPTTSERLHKIGGGAWFKVKKLLGIKSKPAPLNTEQLTAEAAKQ